MKVFATTDRLILREMLIEDAAGMYEMDSDPEVHRYLGNQPISTVDQAINTIDSVRKQYKDLGIGRWSVILRSTGEFIGWAGLKYIEQPIHGQKDFHDLGYRLIRRFWGQGYATEATLAVRDYAIDEMKLDRLVGLADVNNLASNKILRKIGMKFIEEFMFDEETKCNWFEIRK